MKRGTLFVVLAVLVVLVLFFSFGFTKPPADANRAEITDKTSAESNAGGVQFQEYEPTENEVAINTESSFFEFEGYGPGKSHVGTFNTYDVFLEVNDNRIKKIRGIIQASSVDTGIGGLDSHLKNDDFFDVEIYPEIKFVSKNINEQTGQVTGDLTFHGVTHEVTFPAEIMPTFVSADFVLDTTPFNMKHAGVNKEVRIAFMFSI